MGLSYIFILLPSGFTFYCHWTGFNAPVRGLERGLLVAYLETPAEEGSEPSCESEIAHVEAQYKKN